MASYFAMYKGMEDGLAKLALAANPAHDTPVVRRAYEILESAWLSVRPPPALPRPQWSAVCQALTGPAVMARPGWPSGVD